MSYTHTDVRFYDISLDGVFIDRIYKSDLYSRQQVYDSLISKGFNPRIELSEAY